MCTPLGRAAVEVVDDLVAQPRGVRERLGTRGAVAQHAVESVECLGPGGRGLAARELTVRLVQPAGRPVSGEIRREEDARHLRDGGVEGDRAVVGDEHVEGGQRRRDIGEHIAAEQPDARRVRGAFRIRARAEGVGANEQRRARAVGPVGDRPPLVCGRNRSIHRTVAPGRRVEGDRSVVGQSRAARRDQRLRHEGASGLTARLGSAREQHVVARVSRDDDARRRQGERRADARRHELRRHREERDLGRGPPVQPGHEAADPRQRADEGQTSRRPGVEVQALERDAVPQLHDARTAHAEAVDVAEPVRHDDNSRAQRRPETARPALRQSPHAARPRLGELGVTRGEPRHVPCGVDLARVVVQRERALAEPDARGEDPAAGASRHEHGDERPERIERGASENARVAGAEREAGHRARFCHAVVVRHPG